MCQYILVARYFGQSHNQTYTNIRTLKDKNLIKSLAEHELVLESYILVTNEIRLLFSDYSRQH